MLVSQSPLRLSKRFSHQVVVGAKGLLPMLYRAAELCAKLHITPGTLREWMRHDLPFQRDARGHLWLDGQAVAQWVAMARQARSRQKLKPDEAYCLKCNQAVPFTNFTERKNGRHTLRTGQCPLCAKTINRGGRND